MATLSELVDGGQLFSWEVELESHQQIDRSLYGSPRLEEWIRNTLPGLASSWNLEETPAQQIDALTAIFVAGEPLTYVHQFNPLVHHGAGVWEFKTADVRIFGWFVQRDCFVAFSADEVWRVKESNLYAGYAGEVVRFRNSLDLNNPKFVSGDNPNDVVSAFAYP